VVKKSISVNDNCNPLLRVAGINNKADVIISTTGIAQDSKTEYVPNNGDFAKTTWKA
jgi:hypothetical protein